MDQYTCKTDNNCPKGKYCYRVSKFCVDYTNCSSWNRLEAAKPARDGSECGPCKPGYSPEIFTTGEERQICIKIIENQQEDSGFTTNPILLIILGILIVVFIVSLLFCYFKKSCLKKFWSDHQSNCFRRYNTTNTIAEDERPKVMTASAPPEEQDLFIDTGKGKCSAQQNNNKKVFKDTIQYQTARAFCPPSWVRNANYGTNQIDSDSDDVNIPDNENINTLLHQIANYNPDNNNQSPSTHFTIEISENTESQDNARNTEILQTYPSNNNSDADSTPTLNENKRDKKKLKNVIINQSLNHNITMNVNVINGEDSNDRH